MAEDWYSGISAYTEMMRDVKQSVTGILSLNNVCGLLGAEEQRKLELLCREEEQMIQKMESRAFEVAVVGLENSGKSSVANALIGFPALPSASVRCTYTTTEIRADETDHALVEFYPYDAFQERFRKMLGELGIPFAGQADFAKYTLGQFEEAWEKISQQNSVLRRLYDTTTAEDLRSILGAKSLILEYLDREPMRFDGEQEILSQQFQSYITGQADGSDPLSRDERPFAVRRVTIYSTQLAAMRNIVLYDVPGFNSPTVLHREQARTMMDRADAIVLVTDMLSNPNIDGTQLATLREADADHVKLKDKLFVFGNKADLLKDPKMYRDNVQTFLHDIVQRHRLTIERRVLVGSARMYFESLSRPETDRNGDNGIVRLREMLAEYYDTERISVLQRRAVSVNQQIMDILYPAAEHFANDEVKDIQSREFEQVIQAKDDTLIFHRLARQIVGRMYADISRRKPFTHILRERIREQIHPITVTDSLYQEIIGSLNVQGDSANRNELVNANLRMNLQGYLNTLIERMVWDVARDEEKALMEELTGALLSAFHFEPEETEPSRCVEKDAEKVVMRMFDVASGADGEAEDMPFRARGFISLITRFVPGITAAVIGFPMGSQGRVEEAVAISPELTRLYAERNADDVDGMAEIARILTHQDYFAKIKQRNAEAVRKYLRRVHRPVLSEDEKSRMIREWSQVAAQYDIDLSRLRLPFPVRKTSEDLESAFQERLIACMKLRTRPHGEELTGIKEEIWKKQPPTRAQVNASLIASMARKAEIARTEEDVLEEINTDIEIYVNLLTEMLVPHLNLEKAFYERFINQINAMTGYSSVYDHKADALINEWLKNDIKQIRRKQFEELDRLRQLHNSRQKLYDAIAMLIAAWQERYAELV